MTMHDHLPSLQISSGLYDVIIGKPGTIPSTSTNMQVASLDLGDPARILVHLYTSISCGIRSAPASTE